MKVKLSESEKNRILSLYEGRYVKNIINEAYYGIIQEQDDICEIICKRKMAQYGSNGDVVRMIQHLLTANGYNPKYEGGGMNTGCSKNYKTCDGLFRNHTRDTVKEFQRAYGLVVDGKVGYQTWKKMCEVIKFTSSVTKNMFCKDCNCDDQKQDNDFIYDDPKKIIDDINCDKLKKCVKDYIMIPAPDYYGFDKCIGIGQKGDMDDEDYSNLEKDGFVEGCTWYIRTNENTSGYKRIISCPTYLDCMPGPNKQHMRYCNSEAIKKCKAAGCTKIAV